MAYDIDPYAVLGVAPSATDEEIKSAYRRAARRLHPDSNPNNPGAAIQFADVTVAYEMLNDSTKKREYDKYVQRLLFKQRDGNRDMTFALRVTPSKRTITPLPESQVIYLLAEITPDPMAKEQHQTVASRLNLTLVLDQSNSMNGTRLEKVKVAANQIIDQLTADDIISVVSFNDRATVIIPATRADNKPALKARVSMMSASGGTEIFQGLSAGVAQNRQFLGPKLVNHIILLTDGHTYGDSEACLELAKQVGEEGIAISAMGLGHDWNDQFLDKLASSTGGSSAYINSAGAVVKFLNDHVRNLSNAFAERLQLIIAPDPDVQLELAFKLAPNPQPLDIQEGAIPLGSLQVHRPISVLLQFQMPANMSIGFRSVARLVASGDILINERQKYQSLSDISLEVTSEDVFEEPPNAILNALSKLTLYRMQERAQEALERGDINEATRSLENLATRLLEMGESDLAQQARAEAMRVAHTANFSDKGRKTLKYQTRSLMLSSGLGENLP